MTSRIVGFRGLVAIAMAYAAALVFVPTALAMTVDTTADDATQGNGSCALREAVVAAAAGSNSADCGPAGSAPITVSVPAGTYTLSAGQLAIGAGANVVIEGSNPNAPALTTIDAGGKSRVLEVASGAQLVLKALRVTGGQTLVGVDGFSPGEYGGPGGDGGGILNKGALTLERVWVEENFTGHGGRGVDGDQISMSSTRYGKGGGAGGSGGGVFNASGASLSVIASKISDNGTGDGGNGGNGATGQLGIGHFPDGSDGGDGGPSGNGGGIFNAGSATVVDSTIEDNFTGRGGHGGQGGHGVGEAEMQPSGHGGYGGYGGNSGLAYDPNTGNFSYRAYGGGGGFYNVGVLQMSRSTIAGNNTGAGGNGGGAGNGGKKLNNDFQTGGRAGPGGGGGLGGGFFNLGKGATLTNVTIVGNFTGDGGQGGNGSTSASLGPGLGGYGGYGGGLWTEGAHSPDYVELVHVTISKNAVGSAGLPGEDLTSPGQPGQRGKGAGVAVGGRFDPGSSAGVYFKNTVVAGNGSALAGDLNCIQYYPKEQYVDLYDLGNNVSYPDSSCPGTVGDPLLGPLQDNGGLTETLLPEVGSSAIGLVPAAACVAEDQRGFARGGGGKSCDAGAVETGSAPAVTATGTALASSANPSTPGQAVKFTATVSPQPSGGTIAFTDAGSPISGCAAVAIGPGGQASCTVTYPVVGSHSIKAVYSGNSLFTGSSSSVLTQVVQNPQVPDEPGDGGGTGAPVVPPPVVALPPAPVPQKKALRCPKGKKKVVRKGRAKCVPKHKPRKKK